MNEELLIYLWQFQLFDHNIYTSEGDALTIIHPGVRNINSGPDFFNARIKVGETTWAGNVEIHVNSSDWFVHNHQKDPSFDNIILHVVYQIDKPVFRKNKETIPTLELKNKYSKIIFSRYKSFLNSKKWIPCQDQIDEIAYFDLISFFDNLMVERLESRASSIDDELTITQQDFREVFYRKLLRNFGFKVNDTAFELLAKSLPIKVLTKHCNQPKQVEALLYGQAGMLSGTFKDQYPKQLKTEYEFLKDKYALEPIDPKLWKFMRLRPANFPTIRIAQFARVIIKTKAQITTILDAKKLVNIINLFNVVANNYWETHFRFDTVGQTRKKSLGKSSIDLLLINTVIPFMFVYGQRINDVKLQDKALLWLDQIKSENNNIIRRFKNLNINAQNALQSQALLQLKTNYCDKKRCLECRIGHQLLNTQ